MHTQELHWGCKIWQEWSRPIYTMQKARNWCRLYGNAAWQWLLRHSQRNPIIVHRCKRVARLCRAWYKRHKLYCLRNKMWSLRQKVRGQLWQKTFSYTWFLRFGKLYPPWEIRFQVFFCRSFRWYSQGTTHTVLGIILVLCIAWYFKKIYLWPGHRP